MIEPGQNVRTMNPLTVRGKFIPSGTNGKVLRKYRASYQGGAYMYDVRWNSEKLPNDIVLPVLEEEVVVVQ